MADGRFAQVREPAAFQGEIVCWRRSAIMGQDRLSLLLGGGHMKAKGGIAGVVLGVIVGLVGGWFLFGQTKPAEAGNDRFEDYVLTTGPVNVGVVAQDTDGVWILDYKAGKLLGTVVNRTTGKVTGWAEIDLVKQFDLKPKQNVHFLVTTGMVQKGQSALYVAETTTGKLGVYTMLVRDGFGPAGNMIIHQHDMTSFRAPKN
jgi:hypothetical protein